MKSKNENEKDILNITKDLLFSPNEVMKKSLVSMTIVSGPLGMLLDNYHGLFNVLNYSPSGLSFKLLYQDHILLKSAIWVPALFGLAGLMMSSLIYLFDELFSTSEPKKSPSWPKVFYIISLFSAQYYISGLLDYIDAPGVILHITLLASALAGWFFLDNTRAGLFLGLLTGLLGPLVEIFLINFLHLYTYRHADLFGICSWIPYVYFLGAPAVGNLARSFYNYYSELKSAANSDHMQDYDYGNGNVREHGDD
jgi:uncharacterized membrane protein YeaQ/YmgE (transglycosylase-associated protein family)